MTRLQCLPQSQTIQQHFIEHMYKQGGLTSPKQLRGNPTCTNGTALTDYFNTPAVKVLLGIMFVQLNVDQDAIHVDGSVEWTLCADDLNYETQVQDVTEYIMHALNQVNINSIKGF